MDPNRLPQPLRRSALSALLLAPLALSQDGQEDPLVVTLTDGPNGVLTVDLSDFPELERSTLATSGVAGVWTGTLEKSQLRVTLRTYPRSGPFAFQEPQGVTDRLARSAGGFAHDGSFTFAEPTLIEGSYGWVPYASQVGYHLQLGSDMSLERQFLAGLLPDSAWSIEFDCRPPLDSRSQKRLHTFFREGFSYQGEERDWRWTDEEAYERWRSEVGEKIVDKMEKPLRTEHFIILSNASKGSLFAKKMEQHYDTTQDVFPFPEVPGRRLLPIFLFRNREEYNEFCVKAAGMTPQQAQQTGGHASRDYYASWYESPNDPVHLHEIVHQIFANRLRLGGGGSWFQEGVAEYVSSTKSERKSYAKGVARNETFLRFRDFMGYSSLIGDAAGNDVRGGSAAGNAYTQAASLIEFLREDRWARDHFQEFIHRVGSLPRGNIEAIEKTLYEIYEVGIEGVEERWVKFWLKR